MKPGSIRRLRELWLTLGNAIRNLDNSPLREVSSTGMLILAGGLFRRRAQPAQCGPVVGRESKSSPTTRTSSVPSANSSMPSCRQT